MLVVRVEIWPGGDYRKAKTIASMTAGNTTSVLIDDCDYDIYMHEAAYLPCGTPEHEERFEIKEHPRKQSVWVLIAEAISNWQNP